jgi:hypothetical protein
MKSEMPPRTAIAPMAVMTASVAVKPPPEEAEPVLVIPGADGEAGRGADGVVVAGAVGVALGDCGSPGDRGLPEPGP